MKIDKPEIRLAMLGMIEGNGHPYSWSAIVNGYNPEEMAKCPFPVIPQYLAEEPLNTMRIPGARVTRVWTDDPADAPRIAAASKIAKVVARPEDVIGQVDAVIIGTDDGHEHVRRAQSFIEAGLPVFVDKPLAINVSDLSQFINWDRAGKVFLSSSNMRYAPEIKQIMRQKAQLGELRWITACTSKTWGERPYPLSETVELMAVIIAGLRSREREGQWVKLEEIYAELEPPFKR
jgi:predicted dehydrogenase